MSKIQLVDTHCHIHEANFELPGDEAMRAVWLRDNHPDPDQMVAEAMDAGVTRLICVGTTVADSRLAVDFAQRHDNCWATVGLHPHEAKEGESALAALAVLLQNSEAASGARRGSTQVFLRTRRKTRGGPGDEARGVASGKTSGVLTSRLLPSVLAKAAADGVPSSRPPRTETEGHSTEMAKPGKIVAIGECGLDYFYGHSPKNDQAKALRFQIELALQYDLPLVFHVRNALDDFWPIFDSYPNLRGVLHSFTDTRANLEKALERGLYIGANGIMTFTKDQEQLDMAKSIPLQKLLIETDAPFLTPVPFRGKVNKPAYATMVAEFMAKLRGESLGQLAAQTTANAQTLFNL